MSWYRSSFGPPSPLSPVVLRDSRSAYGCFLLALGYHAVRDMYRQTCFPPTFLPTISSETD